MSKTQKPLKASFAAVELTIALHYVFHAPMDKILWDVGAQVRFFYFIYAFCAFKFFFFSWGVG